MDLQILITKILFADEAVCPPGTQCESTAEPNPYSRLRLYDHNWFTASLVIATLWYYLTTLVFELPILWLMGFKSRKAISIAVLANFITVFTFHFLSAYLNQRGGININQGIHPGFIVSEIVVTIVEALIYIAALRKEIRVGQIISASIVANACSAIIGGYIINNLLGGFH